MKKYWRGPTEFPNKSDVALDSTTPNKEVEPEFLSSPTRDEFAEVGKTDEDRRNFLKLMGASFALMGASACTRRPVEKIVPYLKAPEEITPGVANWYSSTCSECESACGVLVKTTEGRPIKFEGNPDHPVSKGGLCARGQASILNVYDADRLQAPLEPGRKGQAKSITWDALDEQVVKALRTAKSGSGRVRILTGEISSPTTRKAIAEFLDAFPNSEHVTFEPMADEEVARASELSYGSRVFPRYRFDKSEYVLSFGADFLGGWRSPVEYSKDFSKTRKLTKNDPMSRLVVFESTLTLTGTNADERFKVKSGDEVKLALGIAHELIITLGKSRFASDGNVTSILRAYPASQVAAQTGVDAKVIQHTASELWESRGKSIVIGGGYNLKGDLGLALNIVVNLLNSALENDGSTVDGTLSFSKVQSSYLELLKLIADMKLGKVDVLVLFGANPVYHLPKSLGFEDGLAKVKTVISSASHWDETAQRSDFVLAESHAVESWGDASPYNGIYNIQQPTLHPLYKTRALEENLIAWSKGLGIHNDLAQAGTLHEYLKNNWKNTVYKQNNISAPFVLFWESVLRDGFFDSLASSGKRNQSSTSSRSFNSSSLNSIPPIAAKNDGLNLVLYPKISLHDGRNANNGWLQELPDPVTKITWDNYLMVAPSFAKKEGLKEGSVVLLKVQGESVKVPVHIQPGTHEQTVALAVGYGRKGVGRVGSQIGVNAFPLAQAGKFLLGFSAVSATFEKTGDSYELASTQQHHTMEGREIVKEATYEEFKKHPRAGNEEKEHLITMWKEHEYKGNRWGMAIDLTSCTGCSACVIACQSENNIPVVGKKFVLTSREMHWLRIDRYYSGDMDEPETVHQPMLCQQCENAPCETVCPVLATMHSNDGINQQVYNRCVGTRYCANNCPYKVRRFNWFTFSDVAKPMNLVYNPDITVRTRGVMEKCTFCYQRIRAAEYKAKDFGTKVADGQIKTACQQSCPTDAIVFGNVNDRDSMVSRASENPRGYHVLAELNVKPSVTYLTKIRNKKA